MNAFDAISRNSLPELLYSSPPQENRFPDRNKLSREKGEAIFSQISQLHSDQDESEFDSRPNLRRVNDQVKLNLDAQILLLLREADQNNERFLEKKLMNRLMLLNAQLEVRKKDLLALSDELRKATTECQKLLDDLKGAYNDQEEKRQLLNVAQERLSGLESRLSQMDKDGIAKDDPNYVALEKEIATAKDKVVSASSAFSKAQVEVLKVEQQAMEMLEMRDGLVDQMNGLINLNGKLVLDNRELRDAQKQGVVLRDMINELLMKFIIQSSESTLAKLKNDQAVNKARSEATQAAMMEQAKKAAEQERKAQEASQKANCISKILGGVLTALGALTTVFGGAGTALMMVGIGMLVADALTQALFGFSLSEKLMSPLMEHIFMPLMEQIGKLVDAILSTPPFSILLDAIDKAAGTNISGMIKTAVAAAVTIAVLIAAAMLLKTAGKALYKKIGKIIGEVMEEQVTKAIKAAVSYLPKQLKNLSASTKQLFKQLQTQLDDLLAKISVSRKSITNKLGTLADATALVKTGTEETYQIISADYNVKAADNRGKLLVNKEVMRLLTENIKRAVEIMQQSEALKNDFMERVSELLQSSYKTASFIAKQKLPKM